jgi:arginine deiminase
VAKNIVIGTTTNGTVYIPRLENIIKEFKQVHLGISVEAFHLVNDYIRYPSDIEQVTENIEKFLDLRNYTNLHVTLRITPSILSIFHLDTVFKFMIEHKVIAESCNILHEPSCLRIELLPHDLRQEIIIGINQLIAEHGLVEPNTPIVNRRREDLVDPVISSIIFEYRNFLLSYDTPNNVDEERRDLVNFLQAFETLRNNKILNYLPNYEEFLRRSGY